MANWQGYNPEFLNGFKILLPDFSSWSDDIAINKETKRAELPFINFSSVVSKSRRLPIFTASNIDRQNWIPISRSGSFKLDPRIDKEEQFSTTIYSKINSKQTQLGRKLAKGHLVKREDVQWSNSGNSDEALDAAKSTFFYSNAIPQHQAVNNTIWKELENSILIKGRSRSPKRAIVFTGPILRENDPWLVIHSEENVRIKCPLRFWKVVYYVNENKELKYAAFIMSHKEEVEEDQYVDYDMKLALLLESTTKPFLEFDEREKYQVNVSLIEKLTDLRFHPASEALPQDSHSKLTLSINESFKHGFIQDFDTFNSNTIVEGIVL